MKTKVRVEVIVEVEHPKAWPIDEVLNTAENSVYCGGCIGAGTRGSYSAEQIDKRVEVLK